MPAYHVTIGERTVRVELRRSTDGLFARVGDGEEQRVDLRQLHGALYALTLGDSVSELMASGRDQNEVRLALAGGDFEASVLDEAHARLASVAGRSSTAHAHLELKAPMPGLLVRLLCVVGDEVQPGQPLAVLQAMKMENELSLPRGGKVTALNVEPGHTVEQGQVLVVLE